MRKMTLFFVALACSVSVCWAEDVSAVIAISADGSELIYEMATVQKITFVQGAETSSMTIDRKGTHSDVTGLRCVMFGTRNLLPTELESVIDDEAKVYVFPNPVQNELHIVGVERNSTVTVYNYNGQCVLQSVGNNINVSTLTSNIYFLKVNNQIVKFIKK
ncbi:MAG: T9SS type A sorting domain-containing protein [Paludibacteraceae bacterium]|jgi:hypothetical protein|nr:T9SS type A sorting domain-containing protein [Paludibacteraceae bacterium]